MPGLTGLPGVGLQGEKAKRSSYLSIGCILHHFIGNHSTASILKTLFDMVFLTAGRPGTHRATWPRGPPGVGMVGTKVHFVCVLVDACVCLFLKFVV